jgi:dipeptidyl aminopeptidase/acylaminoacyl peptidase
MAKLAQGPCQVVALPGNGHGVYVLPNAWNATRQALLDWLQQNLK